MDNQPLISVIVPVYKVEAFLRPCVDSILAQTFSDFELILVDDGSPDNCGAICDDYAAKDSRVHVIHQQNGGLSAARNAGIDWAFANSDSQWLTFVDSDDMIHPEMLQRMLFASIENNADLCICELQRFSEESQIDPDAGAGRYLRFFNCQEACAELYTQNAVLFTVACAKLYKRKSFYGIRYPLQKFHEDEATTYKLLYAASKIVAISNAYYYYRQNPNSIMMSESLQRRVDALDAFQNRLHFFLDQGESKLAEKTAIKCDYVKAILNIVAKKEGERSAVPSEYAISLPRALSILRRNGSDEKYIYYLAMVHPKQLRAHAYWRKIKKILRIPCN